MSHYGPPGGPYDAYSDPTGRMPSGGSRQPGGPPSDPWGGSYTGSQAYDTPSPAPDWGGPSEPPPPGSRSTRLLYAAVAVLVIVVAAGVAYALFLLSGEETVPAAGQTASPAAASATPTPAGTPSPGPTQDRTGLAASRAQEGDCLVNHGTRDDPEMQIVVCGDDEAAEEDPDFEVVARIDEPVEGEDPTEQSSSAREICQDVAGYTHHYYEKGELLNFVLCLRGLD